MFGQRNRIFWIEDKWPKPQFKNAFLWLGFLLKENRPIGEDLSLVEQQLGISTRTHNNKSKKRKQKDR